MACDRRTCIWLVTPWEHTPLVMPENWFPIWRGSLVWIQLSRISKECLRVCDWTQQMPLSWMWFTRTGGVSFYWRFPAMECPSLVGIWTFIRTTGRSSQDVHCPRRAERWSHWLWSRTESKRLLGSCWPAITWGQSSCSSTASTESVLMWPIDVPPTSTSWQVVASSAPPETAPTWGITLSCRWALFPHTTPRRTTSVRMWDATTCHRCLENISWPPERTFPSAVSNWGGVV